MALTVLNNNPAWDAKQNEKKHFSKICYIPSLGLSCFGCCGHHFKDKETLNAFFDRNNRTLKKYLGNGKSYRDFMWREYLVSSTGGCYSLIREKDVQGRDQYLCAVHPLRIGQTPGMTDGDLRESYCDRNYLCATAAHVNKITDDEKKLFYQFLKEEIADGLNSFTYSIINSQETVLLEKYLQWKEKREKDPKD